MTAFSVRGGGSVRPKEQITAGKKKSAGRREASDRKHKFWTTLVRFPLPAAPKRAEPEGGEQAGGAEDGSRRTEAAGSWTKTLSPREKRAARSYVKNRRRRKGKENLAPPLKRVARSSAGSSSFRSADARAGGQN